MFYLKGDYGPARLPHVQALRSVENSRQITTPSSPRIPLKLGGTSPIQQWTTSKLIPSPNKPLHPAHNTPTHPYGTITY